MKALVYHGPHRKEWEDVPDPVIHGPADAIVRMEATTITGTDLHILKGDAPSVPVGRILGHEGVGVVTEVGPECRKVRVGDVVIISSITKCMGCDSCLSGLTSYCETLGGIGWVFGHLIDGTQAEYVRVPFAENGLVPLPRGVTVEQGTVLSDMLPTGYEIGVLYGGVGEGDEVAVIGAGPAGLASIMTAGALGASRIIAVDRNDYRLERALKCGATDTVRVADGVDLGAAVRALSRDGLGVDVAVETVGLPRTYAEALDTIRPGGRVANAGVHGKPAVFPPDRDWIANLTVMTGLDSEAEEPDLLERIADREIDPAKLVTHRFPFARILDAYEVLGNADARRAIRVIVGSGK
ncbi:alcohol dehydrogenase catalytic domain-containing protein [Sinomonas sp. P10A9]|uniref:Alcohol dehydrogenase catalytic domain-containing protein n=1 Tax=Sinomonas puerhi TaxID=3238584 RepID=A0AB39L6N1_9MICC